MGMDVDGKAPTSDVGKYFRNNIWWWRPLWQYCCEVAPELTGKVKYGESNDGDGLEAEDSKALAFRLKGAVAEGHTKRYENAHKARLDALPDEVCDLCDGTGTRPDMVVKDGCNKCIGEGKVRPIATFYPFTEDNVKEWVLFLEDCGGFEIN